MPRDEFGRIAKEKPVYLRVEARLFKPTAILSVQPSVKPSKPVLRRGYFRVSVGIADLIIDW